MIREMGKVKGKENFNPKKLKNGEKPKVMRLTLQIIMRQVATLRVAPPLRI